MRKCGFLAFALAAALAGCTIAPVTTPPGTTPPPASGGGTPTPVSDSNAYPFAQPANYKGGLLELGKGSNRLEIDVANNPSGMPSQTADMAIRVTPAGGSAAVVGAPFHVYSGAGMGLQGDDVFVFHGEFGPKPTVEIIPTSPGGLPGTWINAVSIDYSPLVSNSCNDSRGSCGVNAPQVFDSAGNAITFGPSVYVAPPPPPPPVLPQTIISGATIDGAPQPDARLADLVAKVPAGGHLVLPAGLITGTAAVPAGATISGAGMGKTIIDGTGIQPIYQKGGLVPLGAGVVIEDLTIRNMTIPDAAGGNGAGVREVGDGAPFTLNRVEIDHNQNGILTFADNITINGSNFHDNGASSGASRGYVHNLYVGGNPTSTLSIADTVSSSPNGAHAAKSRAGTTIIARSTFTAGGDGSALDVPDGGAVSLTDVTLVQPGTGATHTVLGLAMESARNSATGMTAVGHRLKIVDPAGVAIVSCGNGYTLDLTSGDNTYVGPNAGPDIRGCTLTGSFQKAAK